MTSEDLYKPFALRAATERVLHSPGLWHAGLSLTVAGQQDGNCLHCIPVLQLADEGSTRLAAGRPDAQHGRPQDAPASCRQQHLLILSAFLHAHLHRQASATSQAHERLEALTSRIQDAPPCCRVASLIFPHRSVRKPARDRDVCTLQASLRAARPGYLLLGRRFFNGRPMKDTTKTRNQSNDLPASLLLPHSTICKPLLDTQCHNCRQS